MVAESNTKITVHLMTNIFMVLMGFPVNINRCQAAFSSSRWWDL